MLQGKRKGAPAVQGPANALAPLSSTPPYRRDHHSERALRMSLVKTDCLKNHHPLLWAHDSISLFWVTRLGGAGTGNSSHRRSGKQFVGTTHNKATQTPAERRRACVRACCAVLCLRAASCVVEFFESPSPPNMIFFVAPFAVSPVYITDTPRPC